MWLYVHIFYKIFLKTVSTRKETLEVMICKNVCCENVFKLVLTKFYLALFSVMLLCEKDA